MGNTAEARDTLAELGEEIDAIQPSSAVRVWSIGKGSDAREYTQRPMSYFQKLQLFSVLGEAIDRITQGPDGLNTAELFGQKSASVSPDGTVSFGGGEGDQAFIQALTKIAMAAPDLIAELYCVVLNVPKGDREWAKEAMSRAESEGGLSDEVGFAILETFVEQNGEALRTFFVEKGAGLMKRMTAHFRRDESESSKQSSPTAQSTQND